MSKRTEDLKEEIQENNETNEINLEYEEINEEIDSLSDLETIENVKPSKKIKNAKNTNAEEKEIIKQASGISRHIMQLRRKIIKEMKETEINENVSQVNLNINKRKKVAELTLSENKAYISLDRETNEYRIVAGDLTTYLPVDKTNLKIVYKDLYIFIEKYHNSYVIITNQDVKLNKNMSDLLKRKEVMSFYIKNLNIVRLDNDVIDFESEERK